LQIHPEACERNFRREAPEIAERLGEGE